jgi:EmrB/QacA subfamily drug resistance transporter
MVAASQTAARGASDRSWLVVVAMALPLLMLTIDSFGLTVALPSIGQDLHTSTSELAWVLNAFLLAFAAPQIAVGRIADIYGRRRIALLGVAVFVAGSIAAATAQTTAWLLTARAIQGFGTAMSFVTSLSIVSNAFAPDRRGQAIGIWAAAGTIGQSIGPLAAGVLTETLSWRWFFMVNVPLGIAAIALILLVVPESRDESAPRALDVTGFLLVTAGLVLLVFGIQMGSQLGWDAPLVLGGLIGGVVLILLFLVVEPRRRTPLVDLALFRNATFLGSLVILFSWNWVWSAMMFLLTLYLQHIRDLTPIQTGLMFLTFAVPFVASSSVAGRVARTLGQRITTMIGLFCVAVGSLIFAVVAADGSLVVVGLGFAGFGVGGALAYNAAATSGMSAIPEAKAGTASGIQNTLLQVGAAFGLAVANALFKGVENERVASLLRGAGATLTGDETAEIRNLLSGSDAAQAQLRTLAPTAAEAVERIVSDAFMDGFRAAMLLCVGVSLVAIIITLAVRSRVGAAAATHAPAGSGPTPSH